MQDVVDSAAVATTLPQEEKEPISHESQIFVGTGSRTIALNVNLASASVEEVKRLIEEREGIPVSEQHLSFGGKPLRHGTCLRDYDALGDGSTINVIPRIRGGNRSEDMELRRLVASSEVLVLTETKTCGATTVTTVLSEVGGSILHGVLTCILSAHRAELAFNGACGMNELRVHVYEGGAQQQLVVSRVYVSGDVGLVALNSESQKADYKELKQVIGELFPDESSRKAQLVRSIYKLLGELAADDGASEDDGAGSKIPSGLLVDKPAKRTQLLQAYAAMVRTPVAVSTMCLNLQRFYQQLDAGRQTLFTDALANAQGETNILKEQVDKQPLFKKVYEKPPNSSKGNNNNSSGSGNVNRYEGSRSDGLLTFARNWFTHVPKERLDQGTPKFQELPQLDCIFTHHFPQFIPAALEHLYMTLDEQHCTLLTRVLA